MRRSFRGVTGITLGLMLLACSVVALLSSHAAKAQSGQAFSISPPLIELKADPGATVTAKIKLTNVSAGELLIKTQLNDFDAKNETGEPNIIFEDDQPTASHSLRQWISSPDPFVLGSQQSRTVDFAISVPADAEPGGHYAVVRFTGAEPSLEESGVALSASIGTLVLLQVAGAVDEDAQIIEMYTAGPDGSKTGFFENGPVTFATRIQNNGNVHVKPTGTIDVYNIFGQKIDTIRVNGDPADGSNQPKSVLPNSIRRFDTSWNNFWGLGQYRAVATLSYGDGKTLQQEVNFWMVPYKVIIGAILLGVALFFALRFIIRRYNQHVINKAGGGGKFRIR